MLNLIKEEDNIDKIYLYAKDLSETKFEFLIKNREDAGIKPFNDPNSFVECSNTMDDIHEDIDGYNPSRTRKILIMSHDMIADIIRNQKFQAIIKELFIRCRKLNISLAFITQSSCSVPKDVTLNLKQYLIMKIKNRKELQNIAINRSVDIDSEDFMKIYTECAKETYSFLTTETILPASDPLKFREYIFQSYKIDRS